MIHIKIYRKILKIFRLYFGNLKKLRPKLHVKKQWCGNQYGGFFITPNNLNENSVIYSFGIGEDISFDQELNSKFNCNIHMFDPTPKSIDWVKRQNLPINFKFYEYGLASETCLVDFFLPSNPNYVSGSMLIHKNVNIKSKVCVQMKSLTHICNELKHNHIDVLKMDIEGAEYDVIDSILSAGVRIDQILIEFHSRFFVNGVNKTNEAIDILEKNGYVTYAVSDSLEEISFIKL